MTGQQANILTSSSGEVRSLLQTWNGGDRGAFGRPSPIVYRELRRLARSNLRRECSE